MSARTGFILSFILPIGGLPFPVFSLRGRSDSPRQPRNDHRVKLQRRDLQRKINKRMQGDAGQRKGASHRENLALVGSATAPSRTKRRSNKRAAENNRPSCRAGPPVVDGRLQDIGVGLRPDSLGLATYG